MLICGLDARAVLRACGETPLEMKVVEVAEKLLVVGAPGKTRGTMAADVGTTKGTAATTELIGEL